MSRSQFRYAHASDCPEAERYLQALYDDPMTQWSGCGGEISQDWLRKHTQTCEKCKEATMEANTP